jgi:predicted secreted acid phosphatase
MVTLSNKILYLLHKIHKIDEWIKTSSLNEILYSYIHYINQEIKKTYTKPPLIIFDVDDTLLDTSKITKKFPLFEGLDPTITFYHYVKELGYHTIILTARYETRKSITISNLNRLNIKNYDDIIFRTKEDLNYSYGKYKLNQRKKLSQNYTIIANVGDQITDFEGGYNGKIIKIPNF